MEESPLQIAEENRRTASQRVIAWMLSLLIVACGATRPRVAEPDEPQNLSKYILVIKELPDGQVKHFWQLADGVNLESHQKRMSRNRVAGRMVTVAWQRDCDEELKKCLSQCMGASLGDNWQHLFQPPSRRLGGKHAECRRRCAPLYDECNEQNTEDAAKAAEFSSAENAIDWLKRHREEVLMGTVIVIAGVAFVVVTGGSGALVLAPMLLFASLEVPSAEDLWQIHE